jgi:hypothetical protein
VIERCCRAGFPEESLDIHTMIRPPLRWEHFEGHAPAQGVVFSEVNGPHSSLTEPIQDNVGAESKALVSSEQELIGLKAG